MQNNKTEFNIMPIGGTNEYGKNCYVIEIDNEIIVIDMGMKFPKNEMYGISKEMPDLDYLVVNKNKIKGLFISHAHIENLGAIEAFAKEIPNCSIYGSKYTIEYIKSNYKVSNKLYAMNTDAVMKFANISVQAFKMSHNIPGNFGYVIDTKNGSIMYTSEFVFEQNIRDVYRSSIAQLSKIIEKRDIKVVLSDSRIAEKKGYTNFAREIDYFVDRNIYGYPSKTFITINSEDLLTLELILIASNKANKKVVIMSERIQSFLDISIKNGDFGIGKESIHMDLSNVPEDAVIVTSGNKGYPFEVLESLITSKKESVSICKEDQILICLPILSTFEKRYAELINQLFKVTENIEIIDQKVISEYSARTEDIKMLLSLTQPDYVIPINGEYRNMNSYYKIMADIQRSEKDVIILTPGQNAQFIDGSFKKRNQKVNVRKILLEDSENPEVMDNILKDRQRMSESGIFVVSFTITPTHEIVDNHIEIISRGYVETEKYNESMYETRKIIFEYTKQCREDSNYNWSEYRNEVRNQIGRRLGKINGNKPMIATIISDSVFIPKGTKNERKEKKENSPE